VHSHLPIFCQCQNGYGRWHSINLPFYDTAFCSSPGQSECGRCQHRQPSILQHNLLLASAKAYATAGRASPTFHFATQSSALLQCRSVCDRWQSITNLPSCQTIFCSSLLPKHIRPLAELAPTLSTSDNYRNSSPTQRSCNPFNLHTIDYHSSSTSANLTPVLKIVNVLGDWINKLSIPIHQLSNSAISRLILFSCLSATHPTTIMPWSLLGFLITPSLALNCPQIQNSLAIPPLRYVITQPLAWWSPSSPLFSTNTTLSLPDQSVYQKLIVRQLESFP
jgi:hypothetical protein